MAEPVSRVYRAVTRADAERWYHADAKTLAEHGYVPAAEEWSSALGQAVLSVRYVHDPQQAPAVLVTLAGFTPEPSATPTQRIAAVTSTSESSTPISSPTPRRPDAQLPRPLKAVLVLIPVALLGGVLYIVAVGSQTPGVLVVPTSPPTATIAVVTPAAATSAPATPSPPTPEATVAPPTTAPPTREPTVAPIVGFGPRAPIVAVFEGFGFEGSDSPLVDGTPRWLGKRSSDAAIAEVIGPPQAVTELSLVVGVTGDNAADLGALVGLFLGLYAPDSVDWAMDQIESIDTAGDIDASRRFGDVRVHLQTLTLGDGVLVTTTIERV